VPETASARDWARPGLSPRGRAVARAAIEAFLCDGDGTLVPPDSAWCDRVVESYDLSIGACSPQIRVLMRLFVWLLEWLPLWVIGKKSRMSRLAVADRLRYLRALEAHRSAPFALLFVGLKIPMLMSAFEQGEALAITGYDRPTTYARRGGRLAVTR
jgi:hypothetical protein